MKFILEKRAFALISVALILPFIFGLCAIAYDLSITLKNHSRLQDALREASFLSASSEEDLESRVKTLASEYLGSDKNVSNIQIKQIDGITKVTADITNNGIFNKFISADDESISTKGIYGMQPSSKISDTDYIFAISFGKSGADQSKIFNSALKNLCNKENKNLIKHGVCNPPLGKAEVIDLSQTMVANIIKIAKEYDPQDKQYFGFIPYASAVMVKGKDLDKKTIVDKSDGLTQSEYENSYYYVNPLDLNIPSDFKKIDYFSGYYSAELIDKLLTNKKYEEHLKDDDLEVMRTITGSVLGEFLKSKFIIKDHNERLKQYSKNDLEKAYYMYEHMEEDDKGRMGIEDGEFIKSPNRIENTLNNIFKEEESTVFRLYNPKVDKVEVKNKDGIIKLGENMKAAEKEYQSYLEALSIAKHALDNPIKNDSNDNTQNDFNIDYYYNISKIYYIYNYYCYDYDCDNEFYGEVEFNYSDEFYDYDDIRNDCQKAIENYKRNNSERQLEIAKTQCPIFIENVKDILLKYHDISMPKLYENKNEYINDLQKLNSVSKNYSDLQNAINKALNGDDSEIYKVSYKTLDKNPNDANLFIIAPTYPIETSSKISNSLENNLNSKIKKLEAEKKVLKEEYDKVNPIDINNCLENPKFAEDNKDICQFENEDFKQKVKIRNEAKRKLEAKEAELDKLKNFNSSDILRGELNYELIAKLEGLKNEAYQKYKDAESALNSSFTFKGKALCNGYATYLGYSGGGGSCQLTIANSLNFTEIKPIKISSINEIKNINILNDIPHHINERGNDYINHSSSEKDHASIGLIRAALMATKTKSNNPNMKILVFTNSSTLIDETLFEKGLCQKIKREIKNRTGKNVDIYAITLGLGENRKETNTSKYKRVWSKCTNNILIGESAEELMSKINGAVFKNVFGDITYK